MRRYYKKRKHSKQRRKRNQSNLVRIFYKFRRFIIRHPLISSVGSIILSIILIRASFSERLFGANISEFKVWFIFSAILLGIIGLISLGVWFRRNVPQLFTKHDINWRRR